MHDDVTRPESSMAVVVTLKSKMAASNASSGGNSKIILSFDLSESSNKSPEPLLDGPATSEHMSAFVRDYNYQNARLSRKRIRSITCKLYEILVNEILYLLP